MAPLLMYFFAGAILFLTGISLVIYRKHILSILVGVELILNAANLNFIMWSTIFGIYTQVVVLFVIALAVCETALALSIIYYLKKNGNTQVLVSGL